MNSYVKLIAGIMRRSGRTRALQFVPQMTWMLFLRILDEREQCQVREAAAQRVPFQPTLQAPNRWFGWATPYDPEIEADVDLALRQRACTGSRRLLNIGTLQASSRSEP